MMIDTRSENSRNNGSVVLLGLDAAEITVIDQLIAEGKMPHLEKLRQTGFCGKLLTEPKEFLSIVWTSAFTSKNLGHHGWYFNKQWDPHSQCLKKPTVEWLSRTPFWELMEEHYKVALLDVPYVVDLPSNANHMTITGWQCHDDFGQSFKPKSLKKSVSDRFGAPKMTPENFGAQNKSTLFALKQEVQESIEQFGDIFIDLCTQYDRDLVFGVLGGLHRGTHYFWDTSQIDVSNLTMPELQELNNARDDSYKQCDEVIGKIQASLPSNTRLLVFALHGMGPNLGWYEYLPRIVERINSGQQTPEKPKQGLLNWIKKNIPWPIIRQITRRIPSSWNDALIPLWSSSMHDWHKTRYFTLPMDYNGYIRLNIKGREKHGIIEPSAVDYEIKRLEQALLSFSDKITGDKIFSGIKRIDDLMSINPEIRNFLPDLVVTWNIQSPVGNSCGVTSDHFGEISWPLGKKLHSGRSGNHTENGWFIAHGEGIKPGVSDQTYSSLDIAPTALDWLGSNKASSHLQGQAIRNSIH